MANSYLQFSAELSHLNVEEEAWLREQLQTVAVRSGLETEIEDSDDQAAKGRNGSAPVSCGTIQTTILIWAWTVSTSLGATAVAVASGPTWTSMAIREISRGLFASSYDSFGPTNAGG